MKTVREVMVPLDAYTSVDDDASLLDAILALEAAQQDAEKNPGRPRDRAVLVRSKDGDVIGKLSMWDVLSGLEPRYAHPIDPLSMVESYGLWSHTLLQNLGEKAAAIHAKTLVSAPKEDERIEASAPLDRAVGQLVRGRFLSLLVTHRDDVIGVLRLSDVFQNVGAMVKAAKLQPA
jgi:CBS domain-containing protein